MEGGSQRDASGRTTLNAGAEFRRAYLILCFFAVVLVLAFAGTNWDNPGSGSGLAAAGPTGDGATDWADSPDSSGDLAALEAVLAAAEKGEERERAPAKPAVSRAEDGPEEEGDLERPPPTTKTTSGGPRRRGWIWLGRAFRESRPRRRGEVGRARAERATGWRLSRSMALPTPRRVEARGRPCRPRGPTPSSPCCVVRMFATWRSLRRKI